MIDNVSFTLDGLDDYIYWQTQDKKTLRRVNQLIKDIDRNGYRSTGKPELLSGELSGCWSVRIDEKNRLVFRIKDGALEIIQCGSHYRDK